MLKIINQNFTNVEIEIEETEFKKLLRAADLFNTEAQEKLEAKTFGDIIKDGKHIGLVETQLQNHLGNWQFCVDRHKQIVKLEEDLCLRKKHSS